MEIVIIYSQVVLNPNNFFLLLKTKVILKNVGNQTVVDVLCSDVA